MEIIQEFAIENITCSPSEDRQFRFSLVRVTRPGSPVLKTVTLYNRFRVPLPDQTSFFHVYVIGRTPPTILNLQGGCPKCACPKTKWINVQDDMNERGYIFQIYDDLGLNFPRSLVYYRISETGHLVIAVKVDNVARYNFKVDDLKYIRVYTNRYYDSLPTSEQITISGIMVRNRQDVVNIQRQLENNPLYKDKIFYYVDGYYTPRVDPVATIGHYLEAMTDKSIMTVEKYKIGDLRTFFSKRDQRLKYFIHRDRLFDFILYEDDLEIYITAKGAGNIPMGLYYYQNRDGALTNVTDKDFALDTAYTNNQGNVLAQKFGTVYAESEIVVITRNFPYKRGLVYNANKLHELYKIPREKEFEVMSNTGYTIEDFRVETLENSDYWKVAAEDNILAISPTVATDAVGYSAITFYYGHTPSVLSKSEENDLTPILYRNDSTAYEYNAEGVMTGRYPTHAMYYNVKSPDTRFIEYISGEDLPFERQYKHDEKAKLGTCIDFRIIAAGFIGLNNRITDWEDITDSDIVTISNGEVSINDPLQRDYRVIYQTTIEMQDFTIDISNSFPMITIREDVEYEGSIQNVPSQRFYDTVEVFLNGRRLVYEMDWFMDFPHISICNKSYLDYPNLNNIHVRCTGIVTDPKKTNIRETRGYVNNGVLSRNNYYNIREDRVISVWIDGKLQDRSKMKFAEEDNTVRFTHPLNGLPYTIADRVIPIAPVTGLKTHPYFIKDYEKNARISDLFNLIFPVPKVNEDNIIRDHHYLFSPLVAKIILDVVTGAIEPEIYTRAYNDLVIRDLIDERYSLLAQLDPIDKNLQDNLTEIHPHYGNATIEVNVYQYRFINNLVRILTKGNINRVNLSGYLFINSETDIINDKTVLDTNGPSNGYK